MDEALRTWYLGTMGIVRYLPRERQPQPVVSAVPGEAPTAAPATLPPEQRPPHAGKPAHRRTMPQSIDPAESKTNDTGLAESGQGAQIPEPVRLAFWRASDDLAVIDSLVPGTRPAPPHLELLGKILKAIHRLSGDLPAAEIIDWPIAPGGLADPNGARDFLHMFLDGRYRQQPFRWVLLMGAGVQELVLPDTAGNDRKGGAGVPLACGAIGIATHSLEEMLDRPAVKADTWRAIRFLAESP